MAETNSTLVSANDLLMAKIHFEFINEQIEKVLAVSIMMRRAEESLDEDNRDLTLIRALDVICDICGDASSTNYLQEFFDKRKSIATELLQSSKEAEHV